MQNLEKIYIHHNNTEYEPEWMGKMKKIKVLDMGYNSIESLPDLSGMDSLTEVDFQSNRLSEFPVQLLELPNTKLIFIKRNPIEFTTTKEPYRLKKALENFYSRGGVIIKS